MLKGAQTLSFNAIPPGPVLVNGTVTITATSAIPNSGLAVTYSSLTPLVCSVNSTSGLITGLTAGSCGFAADQAGNTNYNAATQITVNVAIGKANQTLTFIPPPAAPFLVNGTITVNATSATPNSGNAIAYSSLTATVCSVNATSGVVTGLTVGTCTVAADQAGNANYNAATQITVSTSVGKAAQTLTFGAAPTLTVGGTATVVATSAAPNSGNPVTYTSTTPLVCSVNSASGTATGVGVGSCIIAADQPGDANYNAAAQVTQSLTVGAITTFTGTTATGTGTATASFTGGGSTCTFDPANTALVLPTATNFSGSFPHGWFKFRLFGCTSGSTVRVSVTWPTLAGLGYLKFGPTPTSPTTSVYYVPANLAVSGNTASFDVTDGGLGDNDLLANGVIADPSGPVLLAIQAAPLPVPTLNTAALAMLLLALGWLAVRARQTRTTLR